MIINFLLELSLHYQKSKIRFGSKPSTTTLAIEHDFIKFYNNEDIGLLFL